MLDVMDLGYTYPEQKFSLEHISFSVKPGEFIVIAGKNGSGKTTLTRLIMSLIKGRSGKVLLHGADTAGDDTATLARSIGYVFQNPDLLFYQTTAEAEVSYGPRQLGFSADKIARTTADAFAAVELTGKEKENPKLLTKGEKQRLAIACAIAMEPEIFILDEPTCGQDMPFRTKLLDMLAGFCRQGKSVLVITHDRVVLEKYASRVLVMANGRLLYDGTPQQLFDRRDDAENWGLTLPTACALSHKLQTLGIQRTADLNDLAAQIVEKRRGALCS